VFDTNIFLLQYKWWRQVSYYWFFFLSTCGITWHYKNSDVMWYISCLGMHVLRKKQHCNRACNPRAWTINLSTVIGLKVSNIRILSTKSMWKHHRQLLYVYYMSELSSNPVEGRTKIWQLLKSFFFFNQILLH
jgi:hypothetical protein